MDHCTPSSVRGRWILFATILASGMAFLDGTVVSVALPTLQDYFHADLFDLQWIIDAYALGLAALLLTAGSLGDIFGQRKIFALGIVTFVCFSLACGLSQSIRQLIIARGLQGVASALMIPGSLAIINACFKKEKRGQAIGLWAGFSGGIAAMGPFVGGWLTQTFSWRYIFYINIPLGLIALWSCFRYVPTLAPLRDKAVDWLGTILILLALSGLAFGSIEGPRYGWLSGVILFNLVGGLFILLLFVYSQKKITDPMLPLSVFRNKTVLGANLVTFFLYFALNGLIFFSVLNFQQLQQYSPIQAGLALLPPILIITFFSSVGGQIADRYGAKIPLVLGALVVTFGMILLAYPGQNTQYWKDFLPGLVLFGLGMALVIAPVTKSALMVEDALSGTASGINNAVSRIAALMAIALLGALALSIFAYYFESIIADLPITSLQHQTLMANTHKLAGMQIPEVYPLEVRRVIVQAVQQGFINGYRWALICCAVFSLVSALVAYRMISDEVA